RLRGRLEVELRRERVVEPQSPARPRPRRQRSSDPAVHRRLRRHPDLQGRSAARRVLPTRHHVGQRRDKGALCPLPRWPGPRRLRVHRRRFGVIPGHAVPAGRDQLRSAAFARALRAHHRDARSSRRPEDLQPDRRIPERDLPQRLRGPNAECRQSAGAGGRAGRGLRLERRLHRGRVVHQAPRGGGVILPATEVGDEGARRVGDAHTCRPQPAHVDQLHGSGSGAQRRRAGQLHDHRLPDAAADPVLHRAAVARILILIHTRTHMSYFKYLERVAVGVVLAGAAGLAACNEQNLLNVPTPDVVLPKDINGASALPAAYAAAIGDFQVAFAGGYGSGLDNNEGIAQMSGLLADELVNAETFNTRIEVDRRATKVINGTTLQTFQDLQRARATTDLVAARFRQFAPTDPLGPEVQALAGFSYVLIAEAYCNGVPTSRINDEGKFEFGAPQSGQQILTTAVAKFDSAIVAAGAAGA